MAEPVALLDFAFSSLAVSACGRGDYSSPRLTYHHALHWYHAPLATHLVPSLQTRNFDGVGLAALQAGN